jgi:hypothetical protein
MGILKQWTIDIPPTQQPMRFGNKAFRTWHQRLQNVISYSFFGGLNV